MSEPVTALDAERALIGAVLAGYPHLDDLAAVIEPSDFYPPLHEAIWQAILRVHAAGNRPDSVSVRMALGAQGAKYDPTMLVDLMQAAPVVGQAPYYAEQVAAAAGRRKLQTAALKVQDLATQAADLEQTQERARQVIDEATTGRSVSRARTLAAVMPDVIDAAQTGHSHVLSTPWPDLDRLIGGFAPGRLLVIGARPGVGKSVAGTNMALHMAAHHGHAVLIASLEMPEVEVGQRLLAAHASVNLTSLSAGGLNEATWDRIAEASATLSALPITVDDAPSLTVAGISRAARDVQRTRDDLALIVVDYLQLVRPAETRAGRVEQLGQISRDLKLLARESGACVVAMAQVNRESVKHGDGKPKMSDLRESGSIEADADQVVLMHQPDDDVPELELLVDKNRHGAKGRLTLHMQGHYARLASVEWRPSRGLTA